jgi:thymidylate synthase ThyX
MKVRVIDCTGFGAADPCYAARLILHAKRLTQDEEWTKVDTLSADEVLAELVGTTGIALEFVYYTFQINGVSRAFTHDFVRTRSASYAQQSQRSVDMSNFASRQRKFCPWYCCRTALETPGWRRIGRMRAAFYRRTS